MNTLRRALTTTAALVVAVSGTLVAVQPASADTGFVHCHWAQLLTNGSFESPVVGSGWALTAGAGPVGWKTDDPGNWVELWNGTGMGVRPVQGAQLAEVNATGDNDALYQDVTTLPHTWLFWRAAHRARNFSTGVDVDKLEVRFGAVPPAGQGGALGTNSVLAATAADTDVRWHLLAGWYHVPGGQAHTRVSLHSLSHAGPAGYGNLVDAVSVIGLTCH